MKKKLTIILILAFVASSVAAIRYKYLYDCACYDAERNIVDRVIEVKAHARNTYETEMIHNITYTGGRCAVAVDNLLSYGNTFGVDWEYLLRLLRAYNDLMILAETNGYEDEVEKNLLSYFLI